MGQGGSLLVIPGRAQREPGIHFTADFGARWIPGSTLRATWNDEWRALNL